MQEQTEGTDSIRPLVWITGPSADKRGEVANDLLRHGLDVMTGDMLTVLPDSERWIDRLSSAWMSRCDAVVALDAEADDLDGADFVALEVEEARTLGLTIYRVPAQQAAVYTLVCADHESWRTLTAELVSGAGEVMGTGRFMRALGVAKVRLTVPE